MNDEKAAREKAGPRMARPAPQERSQPLPWQAPKSLEDDPEALRRVQALLASPSYRPADADSDFLRRDDVRAARLGLDYLKPELLLREQGIRHTIVVFGSTRIVEPAAARRRVEELQEALAKAPEDAELQLAFSAAERVLDRSYYYMVAREFGQLVSAAAKRSGRDGIAVTTGGGPGIMEAANRGAFEAGGQSVGLNITLPHEQYPNPYITPDLCLSFHYFALRKLHFLRRAKALVAFPGGYGTLDELFETLTLVQTRKITPLPVVLVGAEFWSRAIDFEFLVEEGVIDPEDRELFWVAETAEEIWDGILDWHRINGEPLFDGKT
jgi:uncharacterized protein (TIGR00730 family)